MSHTTVFVNGAPDSFLIGDRPALSPSTPPASDAPSAESASPTPWLIEQIRLAVGEHNRLFASALPTTPNPPASDDPEDIPWAQSRPVVSLDPPFRPARRPDCAGITPGFEFLVLGSEAERRKLAEIIPRIAARLAALEGGCRG